MNSLITKWNGLATPQCESLALDCGLLIVRISAGLMMALSHGLGKITKLVSTEEIQFADPIGIGAGPSLFLAGSAEFFCSLAVIIGLGTRLVSIPLAFTMFVAAVVVHADDPFGKKEFALLYLTIFVLLILAGPGRFSLDAFLRKKFT